MNKDKRSTMQYSLVTAPVRTTLHLPYGVGGRGQTKAKLSVWEGEGGAIETPSVDTPAQAAKGLLLRPRQRE